MRTNVRRSKENSPGRLPARFEKLLSLGRREKGRDGDGGWRVGWGNVEMSSTLPYPITTTGTSVFSRSSYRKLSLIKCLISISLSPFRSHYLRWVSNLAAAEPPSDSHRLAPIHRLILYQATICLCGNKPFPFSPAVYVPIYIHSCSRTQHRKREKRQRETLVRFT